jgi:hypothetical protein
MSNVNIPQKNPGDLRTSAEENQITNWTNSPVTNLGAFNVAVDFSTQGYYTDRTLSGNEEWNFTNIVAGITQYNKITTDGTHTITLNINNSGRVVSGELGQLPAGTYDIWMGSPQGTEVQINIPALAAATVTKLTQPTGLTSIGGDATVQLDWDAIDSNADSVEIQRSAASGSGFTELVILAQSTITYNDTTAVNGTTYYYRLVAKGTGAYLDSDPSAETSATPNSAWAPSDLGADLIAEYNVSTSTVGNPDVSQVLDTGFTGNYDMDGVGVPLPQFNGVDEILFNGSNNYIQDDANAAAIQTAIGGDGEIVALFARPVGTQIGRVVSLNVKAGLTTYSSIAHSVQPNNKIRLQMFDSASNNVLDTVDSFDDANMHRVLISSNGSAYKIEVDGVDRAFTVTTGSDDGKWFGDLNQVIDTFRIGGEGLNGTDISYRVDFKYLAIIGRQLTTQERSNYNTFLLNL